MEFDSFDLGPTLEGVLAHVTSISTFLHTTKGNVGTQHCPCVNGHLSRFQGLSNAMRTADIICEDGSAQPVSRIIGLGDGLRLTGEFGDALMYSGSA